MTLLDRETSAPRRRTRASGPNAAANAVKGSSRREARRLETKLRIEKAALKLILERGPGVTAEDIAVKAKVGRRTFFRYFPCRDDVIAAMPAHSMRLAMQALLARPAQESIIDSLVAAARERRLSDDELEIMRLAEKVMRRFPDLWRAALMRVHHETGAAFEKTIAHRLALQGRTDIDSDVVAAALSAGVTQVYVRWIADGAVGSFADRLRHGLRSLQQVLK